MITWAVIYVAGIVTGCFFNPKVRQSVVDSSRWLMVRAQGLFSRD